MQKKCKKNAKKMQKKCKKNAKKMQKKCKKNEKKIQKKRKKKAKKKQKKCKKNAKKMQKKCKKILNLKNSKLFQFFLKTEGLLTYEIKRYFYRIRMAAAKALAVSANKEAELVSLERLIGFFKHQYYDQRLGLPSPNDFSDFSLYYLKVAVLQAISSVKDKEGYTPPELLDFLLDLLKNNENSQNPVCSPSLPTPLPGSSIFLFLSFLSSSQLVCFLAIF